MSSERKVTIQARILSAAKLPRTDMMSMIDPYIKLRCMGGEARTAVKQDDAAPIWRETLTLEVDIEGGIEAPGLMCHLELWDEDTLRDDLVATLDIAVRDAVEGVEGELEMTLSKGIKPSEWGPPLLKLRLTASAGS